MLYRQLAKYYNYVYYWKNYKKDVFVIKEIISRYNKSGGNELLEIGCGTGNYLKYLSKNFSCTGTDVSASMLSIAKHKLNGVRLIKSDMTEMHLGKRFDVVLCLWGVMSYAKTYSALEKTIKNFSEHLKPGGVLIADPWYTTSNVNSDTKAYYRAGFPYMTTYNGKNLKIARVRIPINRGERQIMDIHTLVARKGSKHVEYFIDRYDVGLFKISKVLGIMKRFGIKAKFVKDSIGNGAYIGVKTLTARPGLRN